MATDRLTSMRLADISDREILLIVHDLGGADWVDGADIAAKLSVDHPHANRLVGGRLGWLFRLGAVEREHATDPHHNPKFTKHGKPVYTQRWRLSPVGYDIALGTLNRSQTSALDKMSHAQLVLATRAIAERALDANGYSRLIQRQWRHSYQP